MDDKEISEQFNSPAIESLGSSLPGRYKVKKVLGKGGMGVVFLANDLGLSRDVAIKVFSFAGAQEQEMQERFLREAKALSSLDHVNIVKIFSSGLNDRGDPFHIMEFVEGSSLAEELSKSGKLAAAKFLAVFQQVLAGLSCAHNNQIVHRDLKPSNIILCSDDDKHLLVKIIDFGIARELAPEGGEPALTKTNTCLGSPAYMSPEQCKGQRGDKQSDIYSLGCIMYECLSGETPFQSETALELMYKHMSQQAPKLSALTKTKAGKSLAALVDTCLEKEPSKRPKSAEELSSNLTQILASTNKLPASFSDDRCISPLRKVLWLAVPLLVLILGIAIFRPLDPHTKKEPEIPSSQPLRSSQEQLSDKINRLKRTVSRSKSVFDAMDPKSRKDSEESKTLLKALQHLAGAQIRSSSRQDLKDAKDTCTLQLQVSKSVENHERMAAGYMLRGDAESLIGEKDEACRDFDECKRLVLQSSGKRRHEWQDYLLHKSVIDMRLGHLKEAENELNSVFQFWINNDDFNPKKVINRPQFLDDQGPDRHVLVADCLKALEKADAHLPSDAAAALSISNLLRLELLDLKEPEQAAEALRFSHEVLTRSSAKSSESSPETQN